MSTLRARPSTLKFQRSMRESSAPFMGMCIMRESGNIITYDEQALRLWNTTKQLKAQHHDPSKLENLKFMHINVIDEISCFVIIYSMKKVGSSDEKGGCMRIYSEQLQLLQEIEIKLPPIEKVLYSDNQKDVIIFDKEKNAHILRLEIVVKNDDLKSVRSKHDMDATSFSTISHSLLPIFNKNEKPDYNPKPKKIEIVKLLVIQRIDGKQVDVKDVILIDPNKIMILTGGNLIMVLTRPGLRPSKDEAPDDGSIASLRKKKALEAKKKRETEANGGVPLPEKEFCDFIHTASLVLKLDSAQRMPVMIRQVKQQILLLCYDDGWVQVIQYCEKLLTVKPEEVLANPQIPPVVITVVLAEFQAHCGGLSKGEAESKFSKLHNGPIKEIFDASNCRTFGENGFISEIFTLGTDLRIVHWGIRYTVSAIEIETSRSKTSRSQSSELLSQTSSVASNKPGKKSKKKVEEVDETPPVYIEEVKLQNLRCDMAVVEYLGDYHLQGSAPSDVSQRLQADHYLQYTRLQILNVAGVTNKPVALQVMGIYGGSIMFWDVLHAYKTVSSWHSVVTTEKDSRKLNPKIATPFDLSQMVTQAVRGPDLHTGDRNFGGHSILDILPFINRDVDATSAISTALLMKGDNLDVINTSSGEKIQSFSLNHIMDVQQEVSWSKSLATTGVLDRDQRLIRTQETSEVRATCVHYCPYSHFIVAGYQTGVVGVMNFREPVYGATQKKANYSYLRSNKVHDSDITLIKTFPFKFYPYSNVGISTLNVNDTSYQYINNEIIVAVVGDAQGVISLWQLYPQRKEKSPLLFHNKQHLGKLQNAALVYVPKNLETTLHPKLAEKNVDQASVLVTGCDRGMIYAWRVESNLQLQMIAYIHTTQLSDPRLMTSLTIIPKMVYRSYYIERPPEKTLLSSLTMYLRMKGIDVPPPQNEEMEIANLYFEIYCITGHNDGKLEVWNMSTDPQACRTEPLIKKKDYECAVTSLCHIRTESSNPEYSESLPLDRFPFNTYQNIPNSIEKEFVLVNEMESLQSSAGIKRTQSNGTQSRSSHSQTTTQITKSLQENTDEDGNFVPLYDEDVIMAAFKDGTILMYVMRLAAHESDKIIKFRMFSNVKLPSTVMTILPLSPLMTGSFDPTVTTTSSALTFPNRMNQHQSAINDHADIDNNLVIRADREYLAISEFEVDLFFPVVSKENILPKQWSQPFILFEKYLTMRSLAARGNFSKNEIVAKTMSLQRLYAHKHQIPKSTKLPLNLIDYPNRSSSAKGKFTDTLNTENNSMAPSHQGDDDTTFSDDYSAASAPNQDAVEDVEQEAMLAAMIVANEQDIAPSNSVVDDGSAVLTSGTMSKQASASTIGGNRRQYVGPMETMQRIMSSDLHFAKKDKRLLELFTHNVDNSGSYKDPENYTISPDQAIDIVFQWTNEDRSDSSLKCYLKGFYDMYMKMQKANAAASKNTASSSSISSATGTQKLEIKQDNLRDLFKLLEIQSTDRLKFIEVAKVAAITASALQRSLAYSRDEAANARKTYKSLKSTKTKVTYNSMGERVFEKITISDDTMGKPTGMTHLWRKALYATIESWRCENMTLPVTPNNKSRTNAGERPGSPVNMNSMSNAMVGFTFSSRPSSPARTPAAAIVSTTIAKPRLLHQIPKLFKKYIKPSAALQPLLNQQLQEDTQRGVSMWTEEHIHYFDILRTIRVVRSLLDMRSVRQYEICQSTSLPQADPKNVENMVQLVIKYFERQYGELSPQMNISRFKIINFLEACMQYSAYHPLIKVMEDVLQLSWTSDSTGNNKAVASSTNSLKILIDSEGGNLTALDNAVVNIDDKAASDSNINNSTVNNNKLEEEKAKGRELAIWLVTEVRNMLTNRGCIVLGDVIDKKFPFEPDNPATAYTNIVDTKGAVASLTNKLTSSADLSDLLNQQQDASLTTVNNEVKLMNSTHNNHNRVRWLYITHTDAMHIADEMLRNRAKLGPYLYMTVFQAIESLPLHSIRPPSHPESVPPLENMINMEKFLEAVYFEFIKQDDIIRANRQLVFGEYSQMNVASSAYPRDINRKPSRPLVIDDQDIGFGTYHQRNMSRIQDLLSICIKYDPLRTGELSEEEMEAIVMKYWRLPASHASDINSSVPPSSLPSTCITAGGIYEPKRFECIQLIKISHEKMKIKSIEDKISYIDMIALLLSWEEQQQGSKKLTLHELLVSLPGIVRTIEVALARDLIRYFTTVSAMDIPDYDNPLWVMGIKASANPFAQSVLSSAAKPVMDVPVVKEIDNAAGETAEIQIPESMKEQDRGSLQLSLPMDGVWRPIDTLKDSTVPDDRPGMLHVKSAIFYPPDVRNPALYSGTMKTSASTPALVFGTTHGIIRDEHVREVEALAIPKVIETTRLQTSVLGETVKSYPTLSSKPEPAKITIQRIDGDVFGRAEISRGPYSPKKVTPRLQDDIRDDIQVDRVRSSYSRVLENFTVNSLVGPLECEPPIEASAMHAEQQGEEGYLSQIDDFGVNQPLTEESQSSLHYGDIPDNTVKISFRELDSQSYGLLKEDSLDTADSNYQRYDLAFSNQDSSQLFPSTPPDENGLYLPDARPLTRPQAVLTPFLDFREADIDKMLRTQLSQSTASGGDGGQSLLHSMNRSLASEEISKRIRQLQVLENEFATMYDAEKEEFEKRRKEKELLREQIRREMMWKQREAMKVYHKALEDRHKRLEKGRALLRSAEALEMQDKMAKELEIQALLEQNKASAQNRLQEKSQAEILKKEMEKEAQERERMKKEERISEAFNKARRNEERKAKEAAKKQEEEEFAAMLKKQRDQYEADTAAAAAAAAEAEPELKPEPEVAPEPEEVPVEEEPKAGRRKGLLDGEDEEDEEDEEEEEEEEEEGNDEDEEGDEDEEELANEVPAQEASTIEKSLSVSAEEREYRMSLADKIMQRIMDNIDEAYILHKTHPRNKHDGNFFIPLMFSEDIAFNSFKNSFNDLIHEQIREKQEAEEARRLQLQHSGMESDGQSIEGDDSGDELLDDGQTPLDPFQDIKHAVKKYRRRAEKQRKALFKTDSLEVSTKDWMPLFRKGYADWQAFFTNEKKKREIIEEIIQQIEEDHEFVLEKPKSAGVPGAGLGGLLAFHDDAASGGGDASEEGMDGNNSLNSDDMGSIFDQIPATLLQAIPEDFHRDILPLPYGKVMKKQIVFPNEIKFYQIEVTDANVILTIELKCRKGLASGFLNYEKLPTTVKYLYKISCTKQNNRFARMSIIPEKGTGKYYFAVFSFDTGAEYDLWAYASGDKDSEFHVNPSIEKVNQLMVKWNVMLSKPIEELQTHFPRIDAEANIAAEKAVKQEKQTIKNKHKVLNEMRQLMKNDELGKILDAPSIQLQVYRENKRRKKESAALGQPQQQSGTVETAEGEKDLSDDEMEFLEEMDNIEDFVVKVGRFAMKRSREILLAAKEVAGAGGDDASSMNSEDLLKPRPNTEKITLVTSQPKSSPIKTGRSIDSDSVDSLSTSHSQAASIDLIRPVVQSRSGTSRSKSMSMSRDVGNQEREPAISLSRNNSASRPSSGKKPPSRGTAIIPPRSKSKKGPIILDDIENPNQHADLFSTPTSTKIAAINMIRPLQSNFNSKKSPNGDNEDDFFGEELLRDEDLHSSKHQQRIDTVEEIKRVFDEENEKRREMDRAMATLPHLPGFSLKLAPSIVEQQNRYAGTRESQFVGDSSLMSSTSSVLVKLPPIYDGHNNGNRRSPTSPQRGALHLPSVAATQDTSDKLNRGEYFGELLSDRSLSGVVDKELADIAAKKRPKIHNPLLMSNPKPISYNLKHRGSSKLF